MLWWSLLYFQMFWALPNIAFFICDLLVLASWTIVLIALNEPEKMSKLGWIDFVTDENNM